MKTKRKFVRHESVHFKSLGSAWRRPRGIHNKLRLCKGGQGLTPKIGYGSGKDKGLINGFSPVLIHTLKELTTFDIKKNVGIIASSLGMKKKITIVKKAQEIHIQLLNIKDYDEFLSKVEEMKTQKNKKREKKKQVVQTEEKKKVLTEEARKEMEKEEKRNVLEKGL